MQTIVREFDRGVSLSEQGKLIQSDVCTTTSAIKTESERWQKSKRIGLNRAIKVYNTRVAKYGISRWHKVTRSMRTMEQSGARVIIDILRNFYCRQGFRLYRDGVTAIVTLERLDAKCNHYLATKILRKKRVMFNAILKFWSTFDDQTQKLGVLLNNLTVWTKRNAIKKWQA